MTSWEQTKEIHVLRKRIPGFTDQDYYDLLREKFNVASSRNLSFAAAAMLVGELRRLAGKHRFGDRGASRAQGKYAPALQSLWIAAYNLGIVRDRTDRAMLAFVKRQTGIDHTRFLVDAADARKAIEALKAWVSREAGVEWPALAAADKSHERLNLLRKQAILAAQTAIVRRELPSFDLASFAILEGFPAPARCDARALDGLSARIGRMIRKDKPRAKGAPAKGRNAA